jgi:hypothetical protein
MKNIASKIMVISNIAAALEDMRTGMIQKISGKNIVTYTGDLLYATRQRHDYAD